MALGLTLGLAAAALQAANITSVSGVTLVPSNPLPGTSVTVNWNYTIDSAFNNPHVMIDVSDQCVFRPGNTGGQTFTVGDACGGPSTQVSGGCSIGNNVPAGSNPGSKTFTIPAGLTPGQTYYIAVGMRDYNVYANPGLSIDQQGCASFTVPLPAPFITLTKVAEGTSAVPNGLVLFTIHYVFGNTNNVVITDVVDPQFSIQAVYDGGVAAGQTITWNFPGYIGTPVTGQVSFLAKVGGAVPANTVIPNVATASSVEVSSAASNVASVAVGTVGLAIAKSVLPTSAVAGDTLTYTLAYTMSGESMVEYQNFNAPGIPAGWTNFGGGTWSTAAGYFQQTATGLPGFPKYMDSLMAPVHDAVYIVDMKISSLCALQDAVMLFNAAADGSTGYQVRVSSDSKDIAIDKLGVPQATANTPHGLDIVTEVWYTVKVEIVCNVIKAKVWPRGAVEPGSWDINWTDAANSYPGTGIVGFQANKDPVAADNLKVFSLQAGTNVRLWDTIPTGSTYIAGSCGGCTVAGSTLTWNPSGACGNSGSVNFRATVNPPGCNPISNTAMIDSDDPPPAVTSNTVITTLSGGACATFTFTPTASPTRTATLTNSPTPSASPSKSPTPTYTFTATRTDSPTPSASPTQTSTFSPTPTPSNSASPTPTFTQTSSFSATQTPTASASPTPTATPSPSFTDSPTRTNTPTPSLTSTQSDTFTPTKTFSDSPTASSTRTPTSTHTPTSTFTDTPTASPTFSVSPTFSPSPSITMTFTPSAPFHVNIAVYNAAGEKVAGIADAAGVYSQVISAKPLSPGFDPDSGGAASIMLLGPNQLLLWNGAGSDGQTVAGGIYYVKIEVKDPFGKVEAFTESVNVLRSSSPTFVEIYNSAGELVRTLPAPAGYQSVGLKTSAGAIAPGPQATPVVMTFAGGATVSWDGLNATGEIVAPGIYQIKVRSAKTGLDYAGSVTVLRAAAGNAPDIAMEENPHRMAKGPFRFKVNGTVSVTQISGALYNAAGERVDKMLPLAGGWLGFCKGNASGIYFMEVLIQDQGITRRLVKKIALFN